MNIKNSAGLSFNFHESGAIKDIVAETIRISLSAATPFSKAGANLFLRKRAMPFSFTPLLGPESPGRFQTGEGVFITTGEWEGFEYLCRLRLSDSSMSWEWSVDVRNKNGTPEELDLVYLQDVGMKDVNAGLINEYYVSQYTERRILKDDMYGSVICCRQNMKEETGYPWLMFACRNRADSGCTDGIQFYGRRYRETGIPEALREDKLAGECAGESSIIALQEKPFRLQPGEEHRSIFVGTFLPDHPDATGVEDLDRLSSLFGEFGERLMVKGEERIEPERNIFNSAVFFVSENLNIKEIESIFGKERRHAEYRDGRLLSFFSETNNHVVLKEKELMVDRPHGHIMQAMTGFVPDERIMSTTCYAFGIFNSHITQGNTNFNTLLSICTTPFNTSPETGQRIFIDLDGKRFLLGVPSAFEMGLNHCIWIYKKGSHCFRVRTWTSINQPQVTMDFSVLSGGAVKILVTQNFDPSVGWKVAEGKRKGEYCARPTPDSILAARIPDAGYRMVVQNSGGDYRSYSLGDSVFIFDIEPTSEFCMSFVGEVFGSVKEHLIDNADAHCSLETDRALALWKNLSLNLNIVSDHPDISAIREILPWYGINALVHFLTPYGLEQFSGAAWGTRDVSQGPLDLLLCMEKYEEARKVLCIIFSNQNPDGGWPQWWMFDRYSQIRAGDSHGDIFYWTLIALARYIKVTGDTGILDETLPYYQEKGDEPPEKTKLKEHVERLIGMITSSFIPGTSLVPFGGGDWNDSLQPVSKDLAHRMISSWTVEMNYQAFMDYIEVYKQAGECGKAERLQHICGAIKEDFNRYLIKDGVVAGYGLRESDGSITVLLHPSDRKTNISYSILPMDRGIISGLFTPKQANHHQDLVERYLKGPDGARLMDRPLKYQGGIQSLFQRAESSTFFGREIGLMYVHEHIRYAESLALMGKAEEFVNALRQAIPVGYTDIVPCADLRQSNCYYSSSDVWFTSRYDADERYEEVKRGNMMLKGGWRVYSSGPGIYIAIILTRLLGVRVEHEKIILDPVMPKSFDGLSLSLALLGRNTILTYSVKHNTHSPKEIVINGNIIDFSCEENQYRPGGAILPREILMSHLSLPANTIHVGL